MNVIKPLILTFMHILFFCALTTNQEVGSVFWLHCQGKIILFELDDHFKPNIAISEIVISNIQLQQYLDIMQARMGGKHLKDMKRMRKEKYVSLL